MRTFVDTSALLALLDAGDRNHEPALEWVAGPGSSPDAILSTHSYVVVETAALVQRRLGAASTREFFDAWLPEVSLMYVDEELHRRAVAAYLAGLGRRDSFVDSVSFQWMRDSDTRHAFGFDADFSSEGFELVP